MRQTVGQIQFLCYSVNWTLIFSGDVLEQPCKTDESKVNPGLVEISHRFNYGMCHLPKIHLNGLNVFRNDNRAANVTIDCLFNGQKYATIPCRYRIVVFPIFDISFIGVFPTRCQSMKNCPESLRPSFDQLEISGCTMGMSSLGRIVELLQPSRLYFTPLRIYNDGTGNYSLIYEAFRSITHLEIHDGTFEKWNARGSYITMQTSQDSLNIKGDRVFTYVIEGLLNEAVNLRSLSIDVWESFDEISSYFCREFPFLESLHVGFRNITPDVLQCLADKMPALQNVSFTISEYVGSHTPNQQEAVHLQNTRNFSLKIMPSLYPLQVNVQSVIYDYSKVSMPSLTHFHIVYCEEESQSALITKEIFENMKTYMPDLEELFIDIRYKNAKNGYLNLKDFPWEQVYFNVNFIVYMYAKRSLTLHLNIPDLESYSLIPVNTPVYDFSGIEMPPMKTSIIKFTQNKLQNLGRGFFEAFHLFPLHEFITGPLSIETYKEFMHDFFEEDYDQIWILDMSCNEIASLHPHCFKGLQYLDVLNISHNHLRLISSFQFMELTNLHTLILNFNNISELSFKGFNESNKLENLQISHNKLKDVNHEYFDELGNLQILNISNNHVEHVWFNESFTPKLQGLDLSHCRLQSLSVGCFEGLSSLISLNLSHNSLVTLNSSHIRGLKMLQSLQLEKNNLHYLGECLSTFISFFPGLQEINIAQNRLKTTGSSCKRYQKNSIRKIYMDDNDLTDIRYITDSVNSDMDLISLSSNPFGHFRDFPDLDKFYVRTLQQEIKDFTYNSYYSKWPSKQNTTNNIISWWYNMNIKRHLTPKMTPTLVDLQNTSVSDTGLNTIETIPAWPILNYFSFNLNQNQIECGCNEVVTYYFLNLLYRKGELHNMYYKTHWLCTSPKDLVGIPLLRVPQRVFKPCLHSFWNCGKNCICYINIQNDNMTVDCSGVEMKHFKGLSYKHKIEILLLPNNNIQDLCSTNFHQQHLRVLDVRNNSIHTLCDYFVTALNISIFRLFDLRDNKITLIPKAIRRLSKTTLLLSGNRFACICETIWLSNWLKMQPDILAPDYKSISCNNTPSLTLFTNISETELKCGFPWPRLVITLVVLFMIIIITMACMYKFRVEIKVFLFLKCGYHPFDKGDKDNKTTDMDYDAFISYSHVDLPWVKENIVDFLQSAEQKFSVCLHERDWPVGVLITENILLSVQHSRRMIMVLSESYLQSEWCRMEFQAAHKEMLDGRENYLIIIALDDISLQQLPPEIDFYVKTHTYLEAKNEWFQKKLLYAMPEMPLSEIKQNSRATDLYMEMNERQKDRRRFPALFYRMFAYKDGRGDIPSEVENLINETDSESNELDVIGPGEPGMRQMSESDENDVILFPSREAVFYAPYETRYNKEHLALVHRPH